jgi:spore germination protein KC
VTRRIIGVLLAAAVTLFPMTGCWDRKELNELGIVVAIGIDKIDHSSKFLLTSQIVRPSALKKQQGGTGNESTYEIVTTEGHTIYEAIRNTVKEFDRRSFFSHIKVIVVSESIARESMSEIIDFISRTHEIRKISWLMVAQGIEAGKVLSIKHGIENVQATYMEGIIKRQKVNLETTTNGVIDFIKKMNGGGINPVTGVFNTISSQGVSQGGQGLKAEESLILAGTAAYKKDKLVGFLSNHDTLSLNLITGNARSGIIEVPALESKDKKISIEIKKAQSKIKSNMVDGKVRINVKLKLNGNITEVEDTTDISDPEVIDRINEEFSDFVKKNAERTIAKIQKELGTDILGFGSTFQKEYPEEWESYVKGQWDDLFPDIALTVEVESKVKLTGLLVKPLNVQGG